MAKQAKAVRELLMRKRKADDSEGDSGSEDSGNDEGGPLMQWGTTQQYHGTADGKEADVSNMFHTICALDYLVLLDIRSLGYCGYLS